MKLPPGKKVHLGLEKLSVLRLNIGGKYEQNRVRRKGKPNNVQAWTHASCNNKREFLPSFLDQLLKFFSGISFIKNHILYI